MGGTNSNDSSVSGVTLDSTGNAYVTGATRCTDFPTTLGAFQTTYGGGDLDAFVAKLNASGTALVYSTFLGGSGADVGSDLALDSADNAYVVGYTQSGNFPTANAFQASLNGSYDAFVTELNAGGSALVYSSYLGGSGGRDLGYGIAVDSSGSAYVTGVTDSADFPTTAGAFQTTYGGGSSNAFVAKIVSSIWPMFHHDVQHTGQSQFNTSGNPGMLKWKFTTGGAIGSSPAIGADGTLYVGSSDKNLYAINPDGTQKWAFATGGNVGTSPAIGADGTIYLGSDDNNLYAVNPNGTQKWQFLSSGPFMGAAPTIGADGTIYVSHYGGDNNLYAINPDGTQKWQFAAAGTVYSSPAIGADGTVYIAGGPNPGTTYLYALTDGGQGTVTQKWAFAVTDGCGNCQIGGSPAIGADGTIYFDSNNGFLYAVTANGTEKWKFATSNELHGSPAIGADGTVYFAGGGNDGIVYALADNGTSYTEKWQFDTSGDIDGQAPAIGADGTVYVGSQDRPVDGSGVLFAITNSGGQKWAFFVANSGDGPSDSPAIGADGTIYFGSFAGALYALGASSATPTATATATPTATATATATATDTPTATATSTATATPTATATATATPTATATSTRTATATATATRTATATATKTATATATRTATPTATATPKPGVFSLNEDELLFDPREVGATSSPQTITVTDNSANQISSLSLSITGDFAKSTNCGSSLTGHAYCNVSVTFHPTGNGFRIGALTITGTASNSPQTVFLLGFGY